MRAPLGRAAPAVDVLSIHEAAMRRRTGGLCLQAAMRFDKVRRPS
jgi:hypothetical protein